MTIDYLEEFDIDLSEVKQHYNDRKRISKKLKSHLLNKDVKGYVDLALGISDPIGNYSADEHKLGPMILENNSRSSVFNLAIKLASKDLKVTYLPKTIYDSNLQYLKIGVGSEMACLLQPNKFWVGNVRTIWSHLVIKHEGDWEKANEELELYRIDDASSEMYYKIWRDIYLSMQSSMNIIEEIFLERAIDQSVTPGNLKYIWIDAICNSLYECE